MCGYRYLVKSHYSISGELSWSVCGDIGLQVGGGGLHMPRHVQLILELDVTVKSQCHVTSPVTWGGIARPSRQNPGMLHHVICMHALIAELIVLCCPSGSVED